MPSGPDISEGVQQRVLVTGAAGRIGRYFAGHARTRFDLRLMVRTTDPDIQSLRSLGEVVEVELSDLPALKHACRGIDAMVHLAGNPDGSAAWAELLETNVVGTYNAFVAAKAAGVRRVVYASSIHAVSGYPVDYQVHANDPVNPGDLYGVTKCFGEALGRYMAEQEGLSVICLRIGAFQSPDAVAGETGLKMLDAWVSHRDLTQLLTRCIEAGPIRFAIFHALSDNRYKRLDITDARDRVGYAPEDDIARTNADLIPLHLSDRRQTHGAVADGNPSGLRADVGPTPSEPV